MGGSPLINNSPDQRTRTEPLYNFIFGTSNSSSVKGEANTQRDLNDVIDGEQIQNVSKNDTKISQKILEKYQFHLNRKYKSLMSNIKRKHHTFLMKHSEFDKYSTATKRYKTSVIKQIMKSFKWNAETTPEIKKSIENILEGVQKRVTDDAAIKVARILEEYQERIGKHKFDIGCIPDIEYKIKLLDGVQPRAAKNKPLPAEHEEEIRKTIEVLEEYGLIERYNGPWASEAFVVYNGDGSTRMVCNYKWLNANSVSDAYPTASVPDMLNKFGGKTIYSSFDINKAFFNIKVAEESKKYTAFTTKWGTFVWNVMPFGGKNSPATWARASDIVFKYCVDLIKYVDDLIIASKADKNGSEVENHLIGIRSFFDCCMKYNIKIKLSKCALFVKEVKFLGNIITPDGRRVDDAYVKKLWEFSHPQSRSELRAYLGAIEWIARHVYGFKKLMQPLRPLLKTKTPWHWNDKHQDAWNSIQNLLKDTEMLHHPDFDEPFYIFCDASKYYYGAVLFQKRHGKYVVIDMFSRSWTGSNANKHITTKELLALVDAVKIWRQYLYTRKFYIHSDSKNLEYLFRRTESRRTDNKMHYSWVQLLSQFSFEVRFIKGIHNKVADYLSRYIKHPEKLKSFKEGDRPLAEYNKHKRMKFHWDRKGKNKFKTTKQHQHLQRTIPEMLKYGVLPFDSEYDRDVAMLSIKQTKSHSHFANDRAYTKWNAVMPEEIDILEVAHSISYKSELCFVQKMKRKEHVLYRTRSKTNPNRSKPNYVKEKHSGQPLPEIEKKQRRLKERRRNRNRLNVEDREIINNPTKTQQRIIDEIDDGKIAGVAFCEDEWEDGQGDDIVIGSYSDANDPILIGESYELPYRVYVEELLNDPEMKTLDMFNVDKIRQNQDEFVQYKIIKNFLRGVDTKDDIKTLDTRTRNQVIKDKLYSIHDEILFYSKDPSQPRICLPPEHRKAAMEWMHKNLLFGCHSDANSMINKLKTKFYWNGYDKDIREYVSSCETCQRAKSYPNNRLGKLKLFNAKYPNEMVAIDHVGILPETIDGARYITTYYDRYSGYTKSICTKSIDAFTTATNFVTHWICYYGPPKYILTDLGQDFRSELFSHLNTKVADIQHKSTTAYHASCNGAVERFNRTLKAALRAISIDKNLDFAQGDSYDLFVSYINSVHNNRPSRRTQYKLCPNEIFLGLKIETPLDWKLQGIDKIKEKAVRDKYKGYVENMRRINKEIADKELAKYHAKREESGNKGRIEPSFKLKQLVFYWVGPYPVFGSEKLKVHWQGPYRIIQIWNNGNNYTIQSVKYPEVYVNANVKRLRSFKEKVDGRYRVHADNVPEKELEELKNECIEFTEEL